MNIKEYFRTLHHRKGIRAITTGSIVLGLPFVGAYSYFLAVKRIKLERIQIKLHEPKSQLKGLKIAQISDLHFGPTNKDKQHFHRAIDLINAQHPDIVVLTGDYYQWDPSYLNGLPQMLSRIRTKHGIFGCLGNHDYGSCYPGITKNDPFEHSIIREAFDRNGIQILANETATLKHKGESFNLVGLHDLWSGMFDPKEAFKNIDSDIPTIVLSHNPDTIKLVDHDFDLMLSGHSHGGQVSWPIVGPIGVPMKHPELRRSLHQIDERKKLYVNRGLGHTFRMRLNSPPEVTLIEIID
jgi:uncharacterized protein